MKVVTVNLRDIENRTHGSIGAGTSATVTMRYTGPVVLRSFGHIIPVTPKSKDVPSDGIVEFAVYTSDDPAVEPNYRGFAHRITVDVTDSRTGKQIGLWQSTVKVMEAHKEPVRAGLLPPAEGLPAKWTTIEELVSKIEEGDFIQGPEGPAGPEGPQGPQGEKGEKGDSGEQGPAGASEWGDVTGKPDRYPPEGHSHWAQDVFRGGGAPVPPDALGDGTPTADKTLHGDGQWRTPAAAFAEHTHDVLDVDGLEAELQDKADAADVHDTDWVLVPLEDGWTGTARVRRTGSLVHFNVTDLVGPDSTTLATFAVIPEGFRAGPGFTAHGVGASSSSTAVGAVAMTATSSGGGPDMSQNVRVSTPSSWKGGAGNIWWHTDEPMPSSQDLAAMRGDGERGGPITGTQIVARSGRWFPPEHPDQVPYSRQDTYPDGDGHEYRRDCSGFVSMCLHADRSYSTRSIEEISVPITKEAMSPGDYLNSPDNHVVLFLGWTDETRTRYYARESSGPKGGTIEREVPWPYFVASAPETYVPLRYVNRT